MSKKVNKSKIKQNLLFKIAGDLTVDKTGNEIVKKVQNFFFLLRKKTEW